MDETAGMIVLGHISGVYGVKGWVKVYSHTDPMEAIVDYSTWYLRPGIKRADIQPINNKQADWKPIKLIQGKRHAKTVVAQLKGCESCDDAQLYIGCEIAITSSQLAPLNGINEFYWSDLIGLKVVNLQGVSLGEVSSLMETGANDVLVVTSDDHKEGEVRQCLIPWSFKNVIMAVNLDESQIEVDWQAHWSD